MPPLKDRRDRESCFGLKQVVLVFEMGSNFTQCKVSKTLKTVWMIINSYMYMWHITY